MKPLFLKICETGTACGDCRASVERHAEFEKFYRMPKGWPVCPKGKPMGPGAEWLTLKQQMKKDGLTK